MPKPFADTATGKIFIGIMIIAGSGILSWFASRATYEPPPPPRPEAEIVPHRLVAEAHEIIEFSAAGSTTPSAEQPIYRWEIGGLEANLSPSARCSEETAILRCRFLMPGTFAVSVEVEDQNGQIGRAVATVTVSIKDGYLGIIQIESDSKVQAALLYDIDWTYLQTLVQ